MKGAGCKTEYFLVKELAGDFHAKSGVRMQVGGTGNKKAVELMREGKIDFAFTCKPIERLAKKLGLGEEVSSWSSTPIAMDPIVVVASPEVGVENLTSGQLTGIFKGDITNWRDVGGADLPVMPAYMSESLESGVVLLFKEFTVGVKERLAPKAMIANGPSMLGNYTSVTPGAVTFMGLNSYREKYGKILAIDGVSPTRENIVAGRYGLAATYYLTTKPESPAAVQQFLDFTRSVEGRAAINRNFVSLER
ncbi:MAG: hypothetical protein Kow0089_16440 [Desulfobulbaceae bacterium]